DDFTVVGHDTRRFEGRDKATGAAKFGIDSRVPGMLFAVVARCPVFGGKLASFDATKAKAVAGVRDVVPFETSGRGASTTGGVAVLADNSWAAIQGRNALEVKWDEGPAAKESTAELQKQFLANAAKPGRVLRNEGDADSALGSSAKKIEAVYELPFAPHACMEPMNCTVLIRPDEAEAWIPTQAPQWAQGVIAEASKLPPEKVIVHTTLMGGGFGRRYQADFVMEAAQVAAKTAGRPVMVLWTREDDMKHGFYRPASYHKLQGALDANGNLAAWKHFQTSTSIAAAGQDPLAFRLKLIGGDRKIPRFGEEKATPLDTARLKGVLQLAAEKAGWGKPLPKGMGRGIATFFSFNSYTAAVAEASVKDGAVKLHRLVYAVDCGRPINPDGIRAQVESAAIYG